MFLMLGLLPARSWLRAHGLPITLSLGSWEWMEAERMEEEQCEDHGGQEQQPQMWEGRKGWG